MSGVSPSAIWLFGLPSIAGGLLFAVMALAFAKKPAPFLLCFLGFYFLSVADLAVAALSPSLVRAARGFDMEAFWKVSAAVLRLRYAFLILFAHLAFPLRAARFLAVPALAVVAVGIAAPFALYSILPGLADIASVIYVFGYSLAAYRKRGSLGISSRRLVLLRRWLACSGFFLTGILLDIAEHIPAASVGVSIIALDFHPVYLVCVGALMASWSSREAELASAEPAAAGSAAAEPADGAALQGGLPELPVTGREREVLELILQGETNAAIAERLFIAESTVKKHVNSLFRKLGIGSRWELLKLTGKMEPKR